MANTSIYAAFERLWQHVVAKLGDKANTDHTHDDVYYTETEIDTKISEVNASISDVTNTCETKADAQAKLDEAKEYADTKLDASDYVVDVELSSTSTNPIANSVVNAVFNILADSIEGKAEADHNHDSTYDAKGSASAALTEANAYTDTLVGELSTGFEGVIYGMYGDDITEGGAPTIRQIANDEATAVVSTKADADHTHDIADVTGLQTQLDSKVERFVVTITETDGAYTTDKTSAEIYAALEAGKEVVCQEEFYEYRLCHCLSNAMAVFSLTMSDAIVQVAIINNTVTRKATDIVTADSIDELQDSFDAHNHDDRYYTETEVDTMLASKSDADHTHDDLIGAPGTASFAEVFNDIDNNVASGNYSHAEGNSTTAYGASSHAEGQSRRVSLTLTGEANATTYTLSAANSNIKVGLIINYDTVYAEITAYDSTALTVTVDKTLSTTALASAGAELVLGIAYGTASHSEGYYTTASGAFSHAEGFHTTASNQRSHAEGSGTIASGNSSHAEGRNTIASGGASHAEGSGTIAGSGHQHVQGRYNIEDAADVYAHIVGNGSQDARSNAHTLDWDGNAWFAGDVTVGADAKVLATVDALDAKADLSHSHDDAYYTEIEVDTLLASKSNTDHNHDDAYLSLTGGTVNGDLHVEGTASSGEVETLAVHLIHNSDESGVVMDMEFDQDTPVLNILGDADNKPVEIRGAYIKDSFGVVTTGDGSAYTATVSNISALTAGVSFTMIPHVVSTSTAPTLNVNGLGAKAIRRRVSNATGATIAGYNTGWLTANKPIRVEYDGAYWIADLPKPAAADISGTIPVISGGTGKAFITAGNFLVGNGVSAMTEKTPAEVAEMILPTVTSSDDGAFLRVVNGSWAAVQITDASEVSF